MPEFTRGFRLHPRSGPALDGAAFPSDRVFVLDDPEFGLATVAVSMEELLRGGYDGARIEWAIDAERRADIADSATAHTKALLTRRTETLRKRTERAEAERDQLRTDRAAVLRVREYLEARLDQVAVDPAEIFNILTGATEAQQPETAPTDTGLPTERPCTDPRHTGAIRERLGCSGPNPATT